MSRDGSGTYSLPYSPVLGGTTISITWANGTLTDLKTEVTSSLDRSGRGGMLAALRGVDGTVIAPAVSFTGETGTGLYRIGAGNPALAVTGTKVQEWTSTGATISGGLTVTGATSLAATTFSAKPTAPATVAADGATTLTTKGYVDVTDLGASITADSNWVIGSARAYKSSNGIVSLSMSVSPQGSAGVTAAVLPVGLRPVVAVGTPGGYTSARTLANVTIQTNGNIQPAGITSFDSLVFCITYLAA